MKVLLRNLITFAGDHIPTWTVSLATFVAGVAVMFTSDEVCTLFIDSGQATRIELLQTIAFWCATACFLTAFLLSLIQTRHRQNLKDLETKYDALNDKWCSKCDELALIIANISLLFDGYLHSVAKDKLRISTFNRNGRVDRLSLYILDDSGSHFVPVGRYSPNPEVAKIGRTQYPRKQGCIGKAWENGWHFDNSFPAPPNSCRGNAWKEYVKYVSDMDYGMNSAALKGLAMKSRLYAGLQIRNRSDEKPIGVLIVESTDPARFQESDLKSSLESEHGFLSTLIDSLRQHIPTPENASAQGREDF